MAWFFGIKIASSNPILTEKRPPDRSQRHTPNLCCNVSHDCLVRRDGLVVVVVHREITVPANSSFQTPVKEISGIEKIFIENFTICAKGNFSLTLSNALIKKIWFENPFFVVENESCRRLTVQVDEFCFFDFCRFDDERGGHVLKSISSTLYDQLFLTKMFL